MWKSTESKVLIHTNLVKDSIDRRGWAGDGAKHWQRVGSNWLEPEATSKYASPYIINLSYRPALKLVGLDVGSRSLRGLGTPWGFYHGVF
jgi:hypothetical protein